MGDFAKDCFRKRLQESAMIRMAILPSLSFFGRCVVGGGRVISVRMIHCSAEPVLFRILFNTFEIVCYSLALCKFSGVSFARRE